MICLVQFLVFVVVGAGELWVFLLEMRGRYMLQSALGCTKQKKSVFTAAADLRRQIDANIGA